MRARVQIADNFRRISFVCWNLSLQAPHFRLFQCSLSAPYKWRLGQLPAGPPLNPVLITGNSIAAICSCLARVKISLYLVSENVFARVCRPTYAQHNKRCWPRHPSCLQLDRQGLPFSGSSVSEVPACCMSYLVGLPRRAAAQCESAATLSIIVFV